MCIYIYRPTYQLSVFKYKEFSVIGQNFHISASLTYIMKLWQLIIKFVNVTYCAMLIKTLNTSCGENPVFTCLSGVYIMLKDKPCAN